MAHLKTSAIYWSLTASILLNSFEEIYPEDRQVAILSFLEQVYDPIGGGFAGNTGAHDPHLLFTLSSIQIMTILLGKGKYPQWFNLDATVNHILNLQDIHSGAFMGDSFGEIDTRFTYCAVASLSLLNRLDSLATKQLTISYLYSCKNFDGGFGAIPGSESHGGNIFCCVSSLAILGQNLDSISEPLNEWLVWRQLPCGGFNGRPEKLPDVCYSWWILSSLASLTGSTTQIDTEKLKQFILNCQDIHKQEASDDGNIGGFSDRPGDVGDLFHTLFALTGLSLIEHPQITEKIDPLYCLPLKCLK